MKQRLLALLAVICLFGVLATPASAGDAPTTNVEIGYNRTTPVSLSLSPYGVGGTTAEIGYNATPSWNGRTVDVEVTISCDSYRSGQLTVYVAQETRNRTVSGSSDSLYAYECGNSFSGTGGSTTVTVEVRADGGKWRWVTGEAEATVYDPFYSIAPFAQDTILIGR